ncbi:calpain-B-like [Ornithodoros turicata]|uniref:calpain-B-like n=1 Tax=Ornithodoros turicata TaxID=34597 RepID=UPI003139D5E8
MGPPKLLGKEVSRVDVVQGHIGDCWMASSFASLTLKKELFDLVVPKDQSFETDYAGIFHFRIWKDNRWLDVVVDDFLPTSEEGALIYMRSAVGNIFWSALLEKAYAKIHGSYKALNDGTGAEAMLDLTGGLTLRMNLAKQQDGIFDLMLEAQQHSSLMTAQISAGRNPGPGLVAGHAYSITSVRQVYLNKRNMVLPMVRLRNPYGPGDNTEWKGAWSDNSMAEWGLVSEEERKAMGLVFDRDGEFWMWLGHFLENFQVLHVCYVDPVAFYTKARQIAPGPCWQVIAFEGAWISGVTSGGRFFGEGDLYEFWRNPQYFVELKQADSVDGKCTLIVSLLQRHRRGEVEKERMFLFTGFVIYKVENPESCAKPLDRKFLEANREHMTTAQVSDGFLNTREVTKRTRLYPGTYCVIPFSANTSDEGRFLLRIITSKHNVAYLHDNTEGLLTSSNYGTVALDDPEWKHAREMFAATAGKDAAIGAFQMRDMLTSLLQKEDNPEELSLDACRSLLALHDHDNIGRIDIIQFKALWANIHAWKKSFLKHCKKNDGLNRGDLRNALQSVGCSLNSAVLNAVATRYANQGGNLSFQDFIHSVARLHTMTEVFEMKRTGDALTLTLNEWLENTIFC